MGEPPHTDHPLGGAPPADEGLHPRAIGSGRVPPAATWRLCTSPERPGALAVLQLRGDIDAALAAVRIAPVTVGEVRLRSLAGVDSGMVARVRTDLAMLTPHGGREVTRQIVAALAAAGVARDAEDSAQARFPEARSPFEAELLDALARAVSPAAIDLLLDQPRRWREHLGREPSLTDAAPVAEVSRRLGCLLNPPMVVAIGASNIGKSTLLNRLVGRPVVAVADEPGTTRDHVGMLVELDGLIVRWVDTPGRRPEPSPTEREALALADALLPAADLVLRMGDPGTRPPDPPIDRPSLAVALRRDLGVPGWAHHLAVSATSGAGLGDLRALVRRALLPDHALESPAPWRFWA